MAPRPHSQAAHRGAEYMSDDVSATAKAGGYDMVIDVDDVMNCKPRAIPVRTASNTDGGFQSDMAAKARAKASSCATKVGPSRLDEDMQAKQRAKSSSAFMKVTPGAQAVRETERTTSGSLQTLDRDIEAKNRARRSTVSAGAPKEAPAASTKKNNDHDADAAAKNHARTSGPSMIPGAFSANNNDTPPSSASASDNDAATKNRARSSGGPAMIPGAFEAKKGSSNDYHHKDIVFGGEDYGSSRKIPANGLDPDILAKQNAASPRYITFEDDGDDHVAQKKMEAASSGAGADASYGGSPTKKAEGGPSRTAVHMATREEAAFINHKLGRTSDVGYHGVGQMELSVDDVEFDDLEDKQLAVAHAVDEEEEDIYIPAAIEYDPDAKPPLHKNRRFRLYSCLAFVLMIVAVTAIVVPTQVVQADNNSGPTPAPTTYRESLGIQEQIEKYIGSTKLYNTNTSHYKALDWLLHEDPAQLPSDAENLVQRYILALFYFHTSELGPWRSCNPPTGNQTSDCQYQQILTVYPSLTFTEVSWGRWLSDRHECSWSGIFCESNKTTKIELKGQKISGDFLTELSHLPFLRSITLAWNEISGPFPLSLAHTMKHLTNIELHHNRLEGTIPPAIFYFQNLIRFNLGGNKLTGPLSIPSDATVGNLKGIFLFENELTGSIPTEFFKFNTLSYVRFNKNNFTGPIPSEIGLLSDLQEFWGHKSDFTGHIPSEIGGLKNLRDLRLHGTPMSGAIPDELYNLELIDRIDLYDSNFSGTISTKIGQLTTLDVLRIRGNNFSGELPTEIGQLSHLQQFWLQDNDLEGPIPAGLCKLREENTLLELTADCLKPGDSNSSLVECPGGCCTMCCNVETCLDG